jgi:ADP-heptose:LPS heptosyltransferase
VNYGETRSISSIRLLLPSLYKLREKHFLLSCHSYDEPTFSYLMSKALRISRRIGHASRIALGQSLLTESIPFNSGQNVVDTNFDLVRHITGDWNLKPKRVPVSYPDHLRRFLVERLSHILPGNTLRFIAVHPGARLHYRDWGIRNYLELGEYLERCHDIPVVFVTEHHGTKPGLASRRVMSGLTLKGLACLLSMATLFVGNNSGPMHIAAAMGTPCVVIQGPTTANWEVFWDDVPHRIVKACHLACAPCERLEFIPGKCSNRDYPHACMNEVSVETVAGHVLELLDCLNHSDRRVSN